MQQICHFFQDEQRVLLLLSVSGHSSGLFYGRILQWSRNRKATGDSGFSALWTLPVESIQEFGQSNVCYLSQTWSDRRMGCTRMPSLQRLFCSSTPQGRLCMPCTPLWQHPWPLVSNATSECHHRWGKYSRVDYGTDEELEKLSFSWNCPEVDW